MPVRGVIASDSRKLKARGTLQQVPWRVESTEGNQPSGDTLADVCQLRPPSFMGKKKRLTCSRPCSAEGRTAWTCRRKDRSKHPDCSGPILFRFVVCSLALRQTTSHHIYSFCIVFLFSHCNTIYHFLCFFLFASTPSQVRLSLASPLHTQHHTSPLHHPLPLP